MLNPIRKKSAFTLVEILVGIAILAVLAAILIPAVQGVIQRSNQSKSVSNVRQIFQGLQTYAIDNEQQWPGVLSQSGGQGNWMLELRQFLYGDAPSGLARHIDTFRDTIFESPAAEDELLNRLGTRPTSAFLYGYGMNQHLPTAGGSENSRKPVWPSLIQDPTRALVVIDNANATAGANRFNSMERVTGRYEGQLSAVFADGHTETLEIEDVPRSRSTPEGILFWLGKYQ